MIYNLKKFSNESLQKTPVDSRTGTFYSGSKCPVKQFKCNVGRSKKAIAESNALYFKSYVNNDASIFINRYADDACLLEPGKPLACGRAVVAEFFRSSYERGTRNGKFTTTAVYGNGEEYVTEEGVLQIYNGKGEITDKGKYLVLWKKTPTGWKMYRDSFSSNAPK